MAIERFDETRLHGSAAHLGNTDVIRRVVERHCPGSMTEFIWFLDEVEPDDLEEFYQGDINAAFADELQVSMREVCAQAGLQVMGASFVQDKKPGEITALVFTDVGAHSDERILTQAGKDDPAFKKSWLTLLVCVEGSFHLQSHEEPDPSKPALSSIAQSSILVQPGDVIALKADRPHSARLVRENGCKWASVVSLETTFIKHALV